MGASHAKGNNDTSRVRKIEEGNIEEPDDEECPRTQNNLSV